MLRGIHLLFPLWTWMLNFTKSQTSFSALMAWMYDYEQHVLESIAKKDVLLSSAGEHVFQQGLSSNEFIPLLLLVPRCIPLPLSSSKPEVHDLAALATVFDISPSLHQSPNGSLIRPRSAVTCVWHSLPWSITSTAVVMSNPAPFKGFGPSTLIPLWRNSLIFSLSPLY